MKFVVRDPSKNGKPIAAAMIGVVKTCPCGKNFTPYRPYQKYCSARCKDKYGVGENRYQKKPVATKVCPVCQKQFTTNDGKRVYCSDQCYLVAQKLRHVQPTERQCPVCGKTFISSHAAKVYCDSTCRKAARRHHEDNAV